MSPSPIGPSRRSGEFVLMTVISDRLADEIVAVTPRIRHDDLDRVVDRPGPTRGTARSCRAAWRSPVHVEVAGLDRQVGRLERAAALLVDDVEGADQPHVIAEVGEVARAPAAVEVASRRPDRRRHRRRGARHRTRRSARGCGRAGRTRDGARATSASTCAGSSRTRRVAAIDRGARRREASSARSPRTSTPISARIRSDARWIASTWSADRISIGRNGLTSAARGAGGCPAPLVAAGADGTSAQCPATARSAARRGPRPDATPRPEWLGRTSRGRCVVEVALGPPLSDAPRTRGL